jgi:hypothetical protein
LLTFYAHTLPVFRLSHLIYLLLVKNTKAARKYDEADGYHESGNR